ncbi:MAG: hypothetical protein R2879_18660 [Saprospiraceae bacterium]
MNVQLVPVVEIEFEFEDLEAPEVYPNAENAPIWDAYHQKCLQKAGFEGKITPFFPGATLYSLDALSDENLAKLIKIHTSEFRDGEYDREETCGLFGGFVLKVDGEDKFYPQCCGELSDIHYWERLANAEYTIYEGHPEPRIEFQGEDDIVFDFTTNSDEELFYPEPTVVYLNLKRSDLKQAVENAKLDLQKIEKRFEAINEKEGLGIENIGGLLIWDNPNYEDD